MEARTQPQVSDPSGTEADARRLEDAQRTEYARRICLARLDEYLRTSRNRAVNTALRVFRSRDDAQDAVQAAAIRAAMSAHTYRPELPFDRWFARIILMMCLEMVRQRKSMQYAAEVYVEDYEELYADIRAQHALDAAMAKTAVEQVLNHTSDSCAMSRAGTRGSQVARDVPGSRMVHITHSHRSLTTSCDRGDGQISFDFADGREGRSRVILKRRMASGRVCSYVALHPTVTWAENERQILQLVTSPALALALRRLSLEDCALILAVDLQRIDRRTLSRLFGASERLIKKRMVFARRALKESLLVAMTEVDI